MAQNESIVEPENVVTLPDARMQDENNIFSEEFEKQITKQRELTMNHRKNMVKNVFSNEKVVEDYHTLFFQSILVEKGKTINREIEREQSMNGIITIPNIVAVMIPILLGFIMWSIKYGKHHKRNL